MNEWKGATRSLFVLMVVFTTFGCGDDDEGGGTVTDNTDEEVASNSTNTAPDDGGSGQWGGANNETDQGPVVFDPAEFIYQSGPTQLTAMTVVNPHSDAPQVSRRVLYEHPYEIHSFRMLRDRTGVVITTDPPDPDLVSYHTYPAYFVEADGTGPYELIPPLEVEQETATLRVQDSVGGLSDRIWFALHQGGMDMSGNMVASTTPIALDNASNIQAYAQSCSTVAFVRSHFDAQQMAVVEQMCGNQYDDNNLLVYGTPELEGGTIIAEEDDAGVSFFGLNGMEWLSETQLALAIRGGHIVIVDITGQTEPVTWFEDAFYDFALAPDRSLFLGRRGNELVMLSFENPEEWWILADDSMESSPSW